MAFGTEGWLMHQLCRSASTVLTVLLQERSISFVIPSPYYTSNAHHCFLMRSHCT